MVTLKSDTGSVNLMWSSGRRLSGRVLQAGRPHVGATIRVVNRTNRAMVRATTDGRGDFVVQMAASTGHILEIQIESSQPSQATITGQVVVLAATRIADANKYFVASMLNGPVAPDTDMPPGARFFLLLGSYAMASHAERPGLFRAISKMDVASLHAGEGLQPIKGTNPSPATSAAESTYRHTRPGGNAKIRGSDRISWTTSSQVAMDLAKQKGTTVAELNRPVAKRLQVEIRTPAQLNADLTSYRRELEAQLAKNPGKNKAKRLKASIASTHQAQGYIRRYAEHQTLGKVPQQAVRTGVSRRIIAMRVGARVLLGISIFISVKRVLEAEPERRGDVLTFEIWDHILFGLPSLIPAVEQYVSEETTVLSRLFPHPYMILLDLAVGQTLIEQDPEGARYIEKALRTPAGQVDLMMRLFGGY